ncbi:ead/Ea22-like family protein [Klebsiella quasipneumoniae]|uniref:ead/Ea22-like family protein n=1 Tax=Klebsiella quasipneumoniae TaxID=1463165 RepID=UPI001EDCDD2E|nr:ead/Ea22-like family protein [Klebsiella quasipneumoniae]
MSDITELAQSLKAAANTTADAIDRLKAFPGDELIDLSQHEGEQVDIDITTLNEWYELSSPANILALVEALEKAQQRISELESRTVTVKLPKPHAHLIWIQAGHAPDDYWDDVAVSHSEKDRCCDGSERYPVYARWEIEEMLAAAGIKVEAE